MHSYLAQNKIIFCITKLNAPNKEENENKGKIIVRNDIINQKAVQSETEKEC